MVSALEEELTDSSASGAPYSLIWHGQSRIPWYLSGFSLTWNTAWGPHRLRDMKQAGKASRFPQKQLFLFDVTYRDEMEPRLAHPGFLRKETRVNRMCPLASIAVQLGMLVLHALCTCISIAASGYS